MKDLLHNGNGIHRTRLVCTVGPGCRTPKILGELIRAGMDIARLHFSYGDHEEHAENFRMLRQAAEKCGKRIGVLQDLCGTKVRMGDFEEHWIELKKGDVFTLDSRDADGDRNRVSINIPELLPRVESGDRILLNDGALELRAEDAGNSEARCKVERGGWIKSRQAVHVPGKAPPLRVPTDKDREDARFGIRQGVDWIALSYASSADEVRDLRDLISEEGGDASVIAKIERREALDALDDIIEAADGIMVARGDLGLEVPIEKLALIQKDIIGRCNAAGKPVITATEMLSSMMRQPKPTRAEITDIANAILDGTDAVMLSGETAVGKYPVRAVKVMAKVVAETDAHLD